MTGGPGTGGMDRLLVVHCPDLLEEDEDGAALRSYVEVIEAVEAYCPWVTTVRLGICSLPARGPARYFGGESSLVRLMTDATSAVTTVGVGVADGLFAAVLAARHQLVVPPGGTPDFLAPFPVDILGRPELAELLYRLGLRTLGDYAALPESHVLGRFGADGVACHQVAGGRSGELEELRQPVAARRVDEQRAGGARPPPPGGGGRAWVLGRGERRRRPGGASARRRTGPPRTGRRGDPAAPGGTRTGPAGPVRHLERPGGAGDATLGAPWPGQIPAPAPSVVHPAPLPAELVDAGGDPVAVSGRGLLTAPPGRLSVEGRPWSAVTAWAGPWPSDERWWSRSRRRRARLQAVVGDEAHLLVAERGRWWVEATYE